MPPEWFIDPTTLDFTNVLADRETLRRINPQRFEMEQLTAVILCDPVNQLMAGYKDVTDQEFWVRGHMPGLPLMPGVIMLEAAAQLCSYYIVVNKVFAEGTFVGLGGLENVRFRSAVKPGERLVLVGSVLKLHRRQAHCAVQGFVGTTMAFQADVIGTPIPVARIGG